MYAQCKACVREGWSLVIFPQGTRNRRTTLPFKDGAFNLAAELDLRVLPVSIHIPEDVRIRRKEGRKEGTNERRNEGTKERKNERTNKNMPSSTDDSSLLDCPTGLICLSASLSTPPIHREQGLVERLQAASDDPRLAGRRERQQGGRQGSVLPRRH